MVQKGKYKFSKTIDNCYTLAQVKALHKKDPENYAPVDDAPSGTHPTIAFMISVIRSGAFGDLSKYNFNYSSSVDRMDKAIALVLDKQ